MDTQTNVDRVLGMLETCGLTPCEAIYVLEEVKLYLIQKQRNMNGKRRKEWLKKKTLKWQNFK